MRTVIRVITRGGIPAFFLFTLILMLLWNEIVAGQLGWGPTLSYLQTAALWFLVSVGLAWAGIAARATRPLRARRDRSSLGERIERTIEARFDRSGDRDDSDDEEDRIERRIKRGFARWVDTDEDFDWTELGELIERKIRRTFSDWTDED